MATTSSSADKAWAPDIQAFAPDQVIPDALVLNTTTVSGEVNGDEPAVRVAYVDDATAQFSAEAATIPEAEPGLSEVLVHTAKVTQLIRISREQYQAAGTANLLSASARRAVIREANRAFLAQPAPTAPAVAPAAGLLNITGLFNGGTITDNLDVLTDGIATLEGNEAVPTHIIAAPDAWGWLRKFKTATSSNESLLGAGTNDADRRLLDLPVLVTPSMPSGRLAVVDRTAIVSAVGAVQVATSTDVFFTSDSIGLRVTFRFGANVVRPERIGLFTVTNPVAD